MIGPDRHIFSESHTTKASTTVYEESNLKSHLRDAPKDAESEVVESLSRDVQDLVESLRFFFFIPPTYANIYQTPFRRADPQEIPPPFGSHPARCKRGTKQACSGPEHRHTISFTFALLILQGQKSSFLGHRNRVLRPPKGAAPLRGLKFFEKTWKCHRNSEPTFVEQF